VSGCQGPATFKNKSQKYSLNWVRVAKGISNSFNFVPKYLTFLKNKSSIFKVVTKGIIASILPEHLA